MKPTIGQWIEAKKSLPTDRDWYLGTFKESDTGWINPIPYICDYLGSVTKATTKEGWIIRDCTDNDNPSEYYLNLECVAWMPLPEPFYHLKEVKHGGNPMKISKDKCDKEFAEKKLAMSDEKCKKCEYLYLCPYMSQAMDEVVNGDQNK